MVTLIAYIVLKYMFGVDYSATIYLVTLTLDMYFMYIIEEVVRKMKTHQ